MNMSVFATTVRNLACALLTTIAAAGGSLADTGRECAPAHVYLVISGVTFDRQRMMAYGEALAETGIYAELGAYYLNAPRPIEVLEGDPPDSYVSLIVRFPTLDAVKTFWNSDAYQNRVLPLRLAPPAADYTVAVYRAVDLPDYMQDASDAAAGDSATGCDRTTGSSP
ncbi:MAG: DUF1330 domain-containing protein [Chromatocurvus sp.]